MVNIETVGNVRNLLQSKQRLERDKGIVSLKVLLAKQDCKDSVVTLLQGFQLTLSEANEDTEWEVFHGSLLGAKCIIQLHSKIDNFNSVFDDIKVKFFSESALNLLTHTEVRVRTEAGELLKALCELKGSDIYKNSCDRVLQLLRADLQRHIQGDIAGQETEGVSSSTELSGSDATNIFHESAGWRHLETTMKCLQCMIEGCGKTFNPFITQELLDLLFASLTHTNRFVRETGFNVCAAVVQCGNHSENYANDSVVKYGHQFSKFLALGLADNWSQVRLASSVATRCFLSSIEDNDHKELFFSALIPRLCLNRYYIAEGVRIYSQETWKLVSQGNGKGLVQKYIEQVVTYYIESTQADNHAVREASCACISELATKIEPSAVRSYVPSLLQALLECFQDDSWPVRDAACIACGNFILSYAVESRSERDLLYELFLGNLKDPIPSVRQGAATALAKYVKAYGDEVLSTVIEEIQQGLKEIKTQPENTEKYTGLDKRPAQFGVVKNLHADNPVDKRHTDQQMYSCGSLAPKMGRGSRGGCSDCRFRRPSEPWERSDGCVYLITELAEYFPQKAAELLPAIVSALTYKHYSQHLIFLETVCKQLPILAKRIGKRTFKSHLEMFFDFIFEGLSCDIQLTVAAAEDCLLQIGKLLGPSILRGRIENYKSRYVELYDNIAQRVVYTPPLKAGRMSSFSF